MINVLALEAVTGFFKDAWRSLCAFLDELIYQLISFLYKLFFFVSESEFVKSEQVQSIFKNIQLLVGVIVMFSIAIALINYVVSPDNIKSGKTSASKLVTKILTSFILLLTVNVIFAYAIRLQNAVIENNFFGKLIIGEQAASVKGDNMSLNFSKSILKMFITTNKEKDSSNKKIIQNADAFFALMKEEDDIPDVMAAHINDKTVKDDEYILDYKPYSIPIGLFICYILIVYIIGVAVRAVQLLFLQIIAPIPILLYILPGGESKLSEWGKQCFITYIDLFIRHIIIYLTMFLCSIVLSDGLTLASGADKYETWVKIAIVIGILLFAKKVPELIKSLFPSKSAASGDFGLNLGKQFKGTLAGSAIGAGAGAITGAVAGGIAGKGLGGKLAGVFGGAARGGAQGAQQKKLSDIMANQRKTTLARANRGAEKYDSEVNELSGYNKLLDNIYDAANKDDTVAAYKAIYDNIAKGDTETDEAFVIRRNAANENYKAARTAKINAQLGKGDTSFNVVDKTGNPTGTQQTIKYESGKPDIELHTNAANDYRKTHADVGKIAKEINYDKSNPTTTGGVTVGANKGAVAKEITTTQTSHQYQKAQSKKTSSK